MKIFAASSYYQRFVRPPGDVSQGISVGKAEVLRFLNGEMHAIVEDDVADEVCVIIGSVAPPDEQLLGLLTLADALKRSGAARVSAFLPYLGYARQDKFGPGESGGIALVGALLMAAGIDNVVTFDVHSEGDKKLIGLPLRSLSLAPLFAVEIAKLGWLHPTVVAPDKGAVARSRALAQVFGGTTNVVHMVKRRQDGIVHGELIGEVSGQIIVVDDILDTGETLVSACKILQAKGVTDIAVTVTHGLFTRRSWEQVFALGVKAVFVSDSCPAAWQQMHPQLQVVSLAPLLPEVVATLARKAKHYDHALT